ncbi:recombinase family protein [Lactobacillus jensenii]|uniref:recombinase family protein n=1 Tax=Lactobacillus jensenii TaxID=109790 RepID=UPI0011926CCE|nr:recombinase family protein [Lactobacillus jensenii]MCW8082151.1 recombinase family protein [Lactobacillus jensenii]MCZ9642696.1 recombinase family protein [Lactobacillus jensenii]MCZ9661109.1 recombinase family protein [Lactobacillus jensenii]MDK6205451.1 recombinase family protein [Lactobacillus jensenii]NIB69912.1 recombinase family protein [Lactobacillus jensenii]
MKKESKNIKKNKIVDQFEFDEFQKWKIEKEKERIKTHVPTIYGYARVSTEEQHLEPQIKQLKNSGAKKIYQEKWTGTTTKRPIFEKLISLLLSGDTLMVTKLDRFARNTQEALTTVEDLNKRGIKINILNMGYFDDSPNEKLMFTMFSAFAQFERDLIVSRTQEGKAYAKKYDPHYKDGRPKKFTEEQVELAWELRKQGNTYKMINRKTGISIKTLQRRFNELKLKDSE